MWISENWTPSVIKRKGGVTRESKLRFTRLRNVMRMPLSIQNPMINVPYFLISK